METGGPVLIKVNMIVRLAEVMMFGGITKIVTTGMIGHLEIKLDITIDNNKKRIIIHFLVCQKVDHLF
jgi:hypothetical protein